MNESQIEQIQQFIENYNDKSFLRDTLYQSSVESTMPFKFLPGHVALLLGAKTYVDKFIDDKLKNKKKSLKFEANETEQSTDIEKKLKDSLISKVVNFNKNNSIPSNNLSTNYISDHLEETINKSGRSVYKCSLRCHLCTEINLIPCIYNSHWQISNIQKHMRSHKVQSIDAQARVELDHLLKDI